MSDLYQQNNESTLTADRTDVYLDWDSGNNSKGRAASSVLTKKSFTSCSS